MKRPTTMTGNAKRDAADVHLFGPSRPVVSRLYKCPRHGLWLELETVTLSTFARKMTNLSRVTFYRCPFVTESSVDVRNGGVRCTYCKPNKREYRQ
jgi:hypothetical protein